MTTITCTDGSVITAEHAYEHTNAGFPSGDWLYLHPAAGWVLIPHYQVAAVEARP